MYLSIYLAQLSSYLYMYVFKYLFLSTMVNIMWIGINPRRCYIAINLLSQEPWGRIPLWMNIIECFGLTSYSTRKVVRAFQIALLRPCYPRRMRCMAIDIQERSQTKQTQRAASATTWWSSLLLWLRGCQVYSRCYQVIKYQGSYILHYAT